MFRCFKCVCALSGLLLSLPMVGSKTLHCRVWGQQVRMRHLCASDHNCAQDWLDWQADFNVLRQQLYNSHVKLTTLALWAPVVFSTITLVGCLSLNLSLTSRLVRP
jgi:hypothetical protein